MSVSELDLHKQRLPTPPEYARLHWGARKRAARLLWRVHEQLDRQAHTPIFDPIAELELAEHLLLALTPAEPPDVTAARRKELLRATRYGAGEHAADTERKRA